MSSLSDFVREKLALPEQEKAAYLFELPRQHTRVNRDTVGDAISYPVRANFGLGIMYYKPKGSDHVFAFLNLPDTTLVDETGALYVEVRPLAADAALGVMTAKETAEETVNEALHTLMTTASRDGSIYLDSRKGVTMHDLLPQSLAVKLDKDPRVPDDVTWVKLSKFLARTPKAYTQQLPLAGGLVSLRSLDMALDTKVYIVVEPPTSSISLIARVLPLVYKGEHEELLYFHTVSDRARVIEVRTRLETFVRLVHEDNVFILADAGSAGGAGAAGAAW